MKSTCSPKLWAAPPSVIICLAALTLVSGVRCQPQPQTARLEMLLAKLANGQLSEPDLWALESQPQTEKTVPALIAAFHARVDKAEKQWIAGSLIRLGDRSDTYFNYLAGYAKVAVEDRAPDFVKYDSQGRGIRGEFSPEFQDWCTRNGKDPRALAKLQIQVYPQDVLILAATQDERARELFREGLGSPNPLVLAFCVQGLGRLHDEVALALIGQAISRVPAGDRQFVSCQLPWFGVSAADRLFAQVTPDEHTRDIWRNGINGTQKAESDRIRKRTGNAPQ